MLNGEMFGIEVKANPSIPAGITPSNLTSVKIDKDYFNIAGGGGGGGSATIDLIYDSGSDTTPAPFNQQISYANSAQLSNYDIAVCCISADRGSVQFPQTSHMFILVSEALADTTNNVAFNTYDTRWESVRFNDTYFEQVAGDNTIAIYKIYGIKF